jgi:hypothetical protein
VSYLSHHYALLVMALTVLLTCQTGSPLSDRLSGELPVHAPGRLSTGSAFTVTVGPVTALDGTNVGLVMIGTHGPRLYHSTFEHGIARFAIPAEHTRQAGIFALVAAAQNARGEAALIFQQFPNQMVSTRVVF